MLYAVTPRQRTELLTAYDVRDHTGLEYRKALELVKAHGVRLGQRVYRITPARLAEVLNEEAQRWKI